MAEDTSGKPPPLMGATAIRPPERIGMEKYTYFLYDPKNGTVLSRTPKSWALIILFYCIYYSCLAGFWLACMKLFLTIQIQNPEEDGKPTWTQGASIIGVNPGVGVRPSQPDEHVSSGIFTLDLDFDGTPVPPDYADAHKDEGSKGYAYRGEGFFKVYVKNKEESDAGTGDGIDCGAKHISGETGYRKDNVNNFCLFDRATLGGCGTFPYGYGKDDFKPCVFLKFNRIMDLKPIPINKDSTIDASLTKDPSAQEFLHELEAQGYPNEVFIKCDGAYPADKEALGETGMKMYPETAGIKNAAGIPLKYFPYSKYRKGKNESPLVAIQFTNLEKLKGRLIHIICKAYYDGVVHSKKNKAGLVKFEMLLT